MSTKVSEVMTRNVEVISPDDSIEHAAVLMAQLNVGALPVCEGRKLLGMLTDRDIVVRALPLGKRPAEITVSEAMTDGVAWLYADQSCGEALQLMGDLQVRRVPVVARDSEELIGIVSIGDLAVEDENVSPAMEKISEPSLPNRPAAH
jgi:CBS domain-containing protein